MNPRSEGSRATVRERLEDLKKIVQTDENSQEMRQYKTERDFHKKKQNQTVCVTSCQNCCSNTHHSNPVILEKVTKRQHSEKHMTTKIQPIQVMEMKSIKPSSIKRIQRFQPIEVPTLQRKAPQILNVPKARKEPQQIQILIQKDTDDKQCLKKLFKKITKLTQQLNEADKSKIRLESQLQNLHQADGRNKELEKKVRQLEADRHKLQLDVASLTQKLQLERSKPPVYIDKIIEKPIEVIKQVPVEKIVEVQIQVPKYIPGPERIVDKIVEVPKYIEVERKVPYEVVKEVIKQIPKEVIRKVEVPEYIEKPVYIDKPIYIDKEIPVTDPRFESQFANLIAQLRRLESQLSGVMKENESLRYQLNEQRLRKPIQTPVYVDRFIEKPVEFPVQIPVVVDRPVVNVELERRSLALQQANALLQTKIRSIQIELNEYIVENESLKIKMAQLYRNIEVLRAYNQEKNRQVETLISNSFESERRFQYLPPTHAYTTTYTGNYGRIRDSIIDRTRI